MEGGEPSRTAMMAATMRGLHRWEVATPWAFDDRAQLASRPLRLLGGVAYRDGGSRPPKAGRGPLTRAETGRRSKQRERCLTRHIVANAE
jgi:hypothetical protein